MYIHGGRDLKEGPISTLWRVNLSSVQQLCQGMNKPVGWDCVTTSGKDMGKISHHTCSMISAKEVAFFGGLGNSSTSVVFVLNLQNNAWSSLPLKNSIENIGRDDHGAVDFKDGSFLTFGGYVNGTRVNEVVKFNHEGSSFTSELLCGGEES